MEKSKEKSTEDVPLVNIDHDGPGGADWMRELAARRRGETWQKRSEPSELSDADHDEILDNPEADRLLAKRAVERAIAQGLSREDAERLYGVRHPH